MGEYNGWTNYETWVVRLWLDNDQCLYESVQEHVKETAKQDLYEHQKDKALREWVEEYAVYPQDFQYGTLLSDLVSSALDEVNWREIRETYLAELEVST